MSTTLVLFPPLLRNLRGTGFGLPVCLPSVRWCCWHRWGHIGVGRAHTVHLVVVVAAAAAAAATVAAVVAGAVVVAAAVGAAPPVCPSRSQKTN